MLDGTQSSQGVVALENELIVRDFIDLLNVGAVDEMRSFLHPQVTYRSAESTTVTGCEAVLQIVRHFVTAFSQLRYDIRAVGLAEHAVLVEHGLQVRLPGEALHQLDAFASFELENFQIRRWQQVHA